MNDRTNCSNTNTCQSAADAGDSKEQPVTSHVALLALHTCRHQSSRVGDTYQSKHAERARARAALVEFFWTRALCGALYRVLDETEY